MRLPVTRNRFSVRHFQRALIESAVSSNRIEGINVDQSRIDTIIFGKPFLKDSGPRAVWQKRGNTLKKG